MCNIRYSFNHSCLPLWLRVNRVTNQVKTIRDSIRYILLPVSSCFSWSEFGLVRVSGFMKVEVSQEFKISA